MSDNGKSKRGRKPKAKPNESIDKPPPKKRGRKPKNIVEKSEVKVPKKRGRKPKEVITNIKKNIVKDEPIILHLPIKNTSNDIFIPKPFIDIDKFNSKYKDIISEPTTNNIETTINEIKDNETIITKYNKLCSDYNNILIDRDKVFPIFLEYNEYNKKQKWPESVNIDCLWCCHSFTNFPFGIPIKKCDDTYYMFGNFCSAECGSAYNFDNNNTCEAYERYSLINYLYSNKSKIKIAGPRLSLKKFGGQLSVEEFRKNNTIYNKNYKLLLPPMISLIPLIEEVNIIDNKICFDNNNVLDIDNNELKLKRSKPLPDSYNTLENCMNLKLV